jgi:hypothetical protein
MAAHIEYRSTMCCSHFCLQNTIQTRPASAGFKTVEEGGSKILYCQLKGYHSKEFE